MHDHLVLTEALKLNSGIAFNQIHVLYSQAVDAEWVNRNENGATSKLMLPRLVPLHGLEPRQAEPESEVLPLHHKGIWYVLNRKKSLAGGKYTNYGIYLKNAFD